MLGTKSLTKMNKFNEKSHLEGKKRAESAYQYWVDNGRKNMRKAASTFKTDPAKLKEYILAKGEILDLFNFNIFSNIDTEEKAYWLGFLYADGSVAVETNNIELCLQLSDAKHIEKYRDFLSAKQKIGKDSYRCRISTGHKNFKRDLIKWGCTPRKSLTVTLPNIDKNLMKHFVRGVFDGDGCISRSCKDCLFNVAAICSGSTVFINQLKEIIYKECGANAHGPYRNSKGSNTFNIFFSNGSFKKFIDWIYFDSSIYLDRKYQRYLHSIAVLFRDELDDNWTKTVNTEM